MAAEQPNGFSVGGGIETAGSIEAIDSMLLQHEGGVLRVFPDWPADKNVAFTRLLTKGAFEAAKVRLLKKEVKVCERTKDGIDVAIVRDVIAKIGHW